MATSYTHILDLPPLHTRPPSHLLLSTLHHFALPRSTFTSAPPTTTAPAGFETYLTRIIASPLTWLPEDAAEEIRDVAAARLAERCGRSAMGDVTREFRIPVSGSRGSSGYSTPSGSGATTPQRQQGEVVIKLHEPSITGDDLGLKTWGSSLLLARRLESLKLPRGGEMLELGAGTGLVGLSAAAMGWDVALTDLPGIVPNLRRNVEMNGGVLVGDCGVEVLDWAEKTHGGRRWMTVVAADPIYDGSHPGLLAGAIGRSLEKIQEARAVVEMPERRGYEGERQAWRERMLEKGFEVDEEGWEVGWDDWDGGEKDGGQRCWWSVWKWKSVQSNRGY